MPDKKLTLAWRPPPPPAAVPQDGGIAEQRATSLRRDPAGLKVLPGVVAPRWTLRDGVCDICTNAIQSAEEYISDPETQVGGLSWRHP